MKADNTLAPSEALAHLDEEKRPAIVATLDVPGDPLQRGRRAIQLARERDVQLRLAEDGVIVDRDATICCDQPPIIRERQRIDLGGAGVVAASDLVQLREQVA